MTILGVLKLAGGCLVPCSQWRKFGGPCTLPSGQVQQPWLSFAKGVPPAPSDVRPVPLLTPAPTARGGSLGIRGLPKHGLQDCRDPGGFAHGSKHIKAPSWVEKGSWDAAMLRAASRWRDGDAPHPLPSHTFVSVPS